MNSNEHFSLNTFTNKTKTACSCSAISIFLIVLFIISPLNKFLVTSTLMKIIIIALLSYTLYLNFHQTNYLKNAKQMNLSNEMNSQLSLNIICSYIFTIFIGLLVIFVIKSFF